MARPDGATSGADAASMAAMPEGGGAGPGGREPQAWRARLWTCLLGTAAFVLVGWALHATAAVTTLVVFAVFFALMLVPLVEAVKARLPDKLGWLGEVAAAGVLLLVASAFVGGLWVGAQQVLSAFPYMDDPIGAVMGGEEAGSEDDGGEAVAAIGADGGAVAEALDPPGEPGGGGEAVSGGDEGRDDDEGGGLPSIDGLPDPEALGIDVAGRIGEVAGGAASAVLNALTATLSGVVIVFFLTLLMLAEAGDWRARLSGILGRAERDEVFETAAVIGRQMRRYLVIRAGIGVLTSALYVGWLWISGVDLLLVWALLTFLLGFIPTLGAIISGILPVIYALLTKDSSTALLAGAGLLVIEQVTGNLIDPKLSGRYVSLSPLVLLVALLVWGWIWGVPGLLLAAPMTIAIAVVCAHVPSLRPVALLMSDRRTMAEVDETAKL